MIKIVLGCVVLAVMLMAALYFLQRSMLFPMPTEMLPLSLPDNVEKISLEQGHALLIKADNPQNKKRPMIIYAHGNAEVAHWSIETFSHFSEKGMHALLLEYPGYAGSSGSPNYEAIEQAALAAFDQIAAREDVDETKIIVYGRSIGGGPACLLAAQRNVAALVLESTFSSLADLVAEKGYPSFLLRDRFDNAAIVSELAKPLFIYHGTRDTLIPFEHAQRLMKVARNAVLNTADCGHNGCPRPWHALDEFFEELKILDSRAPTN